MSGKRVTITGTRGIPARHGGFETFAERLALYLRDRGWRVTVTCQISGQGEVVEDAWRGITRALIPVKRLGALGTVHFDWRSTLVAMRYDAVVLVLGYNTAVFSLAYRLRGIPNVINMDGIEWKRDKWNWWQKVWLYINERCAGFFATILVADHPEIRRHLESGWLRAKRVVMIPYGADDVSGVGSRALKKVGVAARQYALLIARLEPENQVLEIVRAFSRKRRGKRLVVLGKLEPDCNRYHRLLLSASGDEIKWCGAIYDNRIVASLRANATLYLHGHKVGGTNPTLVEALGARAAILAHNNIFNRWVAGSAARYFDNEAECDELIGHLLDDEETLAAMRVASGRRFSEQFRWEKVLRSYESILSEVEKRQKICL